MKVMERELPSRGGMLYQLAYGAQIGCLIATPTCPL